MMDHTKLSLLCYDIIVLVQEEKRLRAENERLNEYADKLAAENARLNKENAGLKDMVQAERDERIRLEERVKYLTALLKLEQAQTDEEADND